MKLPCVTLGALLLLLPAGHGGTETSAIDLRTFIGCAVREFTFLAKKPGCKVLRITTDACWGRCETWEGSSDDCRVKYHRDVVKLNASGCRLNSFYRASRCAWMEEPRPLLHPPYIESYHRVCTYNETKLVTVMLPKCAPGVDPFYTYPVAIRCNCDFCSTATTECETA